MQILPPRRPGQLGAITAGAGVQGPSGGFSLQASSTARASNSPAPPKNPTPPPGSIAAPRTPSVSEQVALKQSTSQAAAAQTMPAFSQGGTYSPSPTVGVRTFVPPPGTPAITQPAKQPNESATVKALANQIPQTPAQVVQKVLARDAGIAVPVKGPPAIIPANPPLPKFPPPPMPRPVTNPVVSPSIAPPRPMPAVPPASGGAFNVNATTASNIPNRMPPPPPPIVTPAVMKTAAEATSAIVGAKIAEQKASGAMMAAAQAADTARKIDSAVVNAAEMAKAKVAEATEKFAELQKAQEKAARTNQSQTASEDAKSKAEDAARNARDAAALAAKQAAEADAAAKQLEVERRKAMQEAEAAAAAADAEREKANKKKVVALEKRAEAIDTQREVSSSAQALTTAPPQQEGAKIIQFPGSAPQDITLPPVQPAAQPDSGLPVGKIALGLGVLALVVYAAKARKTQSSNEAPLIAEIEEDEE
jgi:chemotaxis protein histidine kinase CheA